MKKVMALVMVFALCVSFAGVVKAETTATPATATATTAAATTTAASGDNAVTKLGRGLLNVVASVFEIPTTMMQQGQDEGTVAAFTKGPVLGVVNTVVRALVGVYEVATFPVPIPQNYEPILDSPNILGKEM